jgi:hypothetical protein
VSPLFTLQRVVVRDAGAFGVLVHNAPTGRVPFAVTLERTYPTAAEAGVSEKYDGQFVKLQRGVHRCERRWFTKGGYFTFEIIQPGHSQILFHRGNIEAHSEGCVLVAESFSAIGDEPGILDGGGLTEFLKRAAAVDSFDLEVL